jgi:hypothetical protein
LRWVIARRRMPEQSSDDFQAEPAGYEMRSVGVPIVVTAIVSDASSAQYRSSLDLPQRPAALLARELQRGNSDRSP